MPICIECRYPVHQLYTSYSKADDRSLGKGVRLTQCPRCKRFADKYVEHDFVVLFIDLVLIKPQVYRHLLFNRLGHENDRFDPSITRLGILLLLFDVYLTWARIEKATPTEGISSQAAPLASQPILLQYLYFLLFCTLTTLAFHIPIRFLCSLAPAPAPLSTTAPAQFPSLPQSQSQTQSSQGSTLGTSRSGTPASLSRPSSRPTTPNPYLHTPSHSHSNSNPNSNTNSTSHSTSHSTSLSGTNSNSNSSANSNANASTAILSVNFPWALLPHYPQPNRISTALLVSSCTKLFPILMVIWNYDLPSSASAVAWAVLINNVAALQILLGCGYLASISLVLIGASARAIVSWVLLRSAGLEYAGRAGGMGLGVEDIGEMVVLARKVGGFFSGG